MGNQIISENIVLRKPLMVFARLWLNGGRGRFENRGVTPTSNDEKPDEKAYGITSKFDKRKLGITHTFNDGEWMKWLKTYSTSRDFWWVYGCNDWFSLLIDVLLIM